MRRTFLVSIALSASLLPLAHAEPALERHAAASTSVRTAPQLGQAIHHATDHAHELVRNALQFLGVPYRFGGSSADTGFDCSGFVRATFEQALGLMLPRRAAEQAAATHKIGKDELQPGDLVFFNTLRRAYSHVGIYLGGGQFIHAPRSGANVRIESMDTSYWQKRFNGARRALQARAPTLLATAAPALPRDAAEAPAPAVLQHDAAPGVDGAAALAPAAPPPPSIVFPASGET